MWESIKQEDISQQMWIFGSRVSGETWGSGTPDAATLDDLGGQPQLIPTVMFGDPTSLRIFVEPVILSSGYLPCDLSIQVEFYIIEAGRFG